MRKRDLLKGTVLVMILTASLLFGGCKGRTAESQQESQKLSEQQSKSEYHTVASVVNTIINDDGSKTEEMSDGSTVVIDTEGNVTLTKSDGEVKEMTTEEYIAYQEEVAPESPAITQGDSNNTDTPSAPQEQTQAPEQKPEAPIEKPTEKPTEAPIEIPTEKPTEPPTEAPTEPQPEHGVKTGTVTVKINWYHVDGTVGFVDTQVCDIDAYGDIVGNPLYMKHWRDPVYNMSSDYIITSYCINDPTGANWKDSYISNEGASIKKYINSNYEFNLYPITMSRH